MPSERLKKVNQLIRVELSKIILEDLDLESHALITIVEVVTSPTLEHSTVKISVFPTDKTKDTLKQIKKQIYDIQQILNKRLVMRPVPKIRFEIDTTEDRADKIENLLKNLVE